MKLAKCSQGSRPFWAVVDVAAATAQPIEGGIEDWGPAVTKGGGRAALRDAGAAIPLAAVRLLPPIGDDGQVFVTGANYIKHLEELKMTPPKAPIAFLKSKRALIGATDDMIHPSLTKELDYEIELVAVMGAAIDDPADPIRAVLGYTIGNDTSCRDLQKGGGIGFDLFSGKSIDRTTTLGPWITTLDEIGDGSPDLMMTLKVNGEVRQHAPSGEMTWKLAELLSYVNTRVKMGCGDILYTGTPQGVAWASGRFLTPGDIVEGSIDRLGVIRNKVVAEG